MFAHLLVSFMFIFVVWHFMLSTCNLSQSGIPDKAGLLPGTAKQLHQYLKALLIFLTLHTPNLWYA